MSNRKPTPKTQREISTSLVNPFDVGRGNPNNEIPREKNRALQISEEGERSKTLNVTLQDHDEALLYYINEVLKPQVLNNREMIPVPAMFASPEKWKSYQRDGYLRDVKGAIMAPLILLKRNSIEKNRITSKIDANTPHNYIVSSKKYSSRNTYSNFNILNNRKPEEEYYAVVAPDYLTLNYQVVLYTYYIEHQNKVVEAIQYASDSYWGNPEKFKFRANISQFGFQTELTADSERVVRSTFDLKLDGYLVPSTRQNDINSIKKFSKASRLSFNVETTLNTDEEPVNEIYVDPPTRIQFSNAFDNSFK